MLIVFLSCAFLHHQIFNEVTLELDKNRENYKIHEAGVIHFSMTNNVVIFNSLELLIQKIR